MHTGEYKRGCCEWLCEFSMFYLNKLWKQQNFMHTSIVIPGVRRTDFFDVRDVTLMSCYSFSKYSLIWSTHLRWSSTHLSKTSVNQLEFSPWNTFKVSCWSFYGFSNLHPWSWDFKYGNTAKSNGARSGLYDACSNLWNPIKSSSNNVLCDVWHGALSWWKMTFSKLFISSGRFFSYRIHEIPSDYLKQNN